jgi:hypothetical protein
MHVKSRKEDIINAVPDEGKYQKLVRNQLHTSPVCKYSLAHTCICSLFFNGENLEGKERQESQDSSV